MVSWSKRDSPKRAVCSRFMMGIYSSSISYLIIPAINAIRISDHTLLNGHFGRRLCIEVDNAVIARNYNNRKNAPLVYRRAFHDFNILVNSSA